MRRTAAWLTVGLMVVVGFVPGAAMAEEREAPVPALTPAAVVDPPAPTEAGFTRGPGFIDFGARIAQRRPNSPFTCRNAFPLVGGFRNCTFESLNFRTGESFQPPVGRGRITQVRVRVGNRTGPMRVEVLQALRPVRPTGRVCCTLIRRSRVFTPARNRITTINVNLPIFQSRRPTPQGYYIDQRLALSVLGGNIPIPANLNAGSSISAWYPAWNRIGQTRAGPAGGSGAMVLLRARWRPA